MFDKIHIIFFIDIDHTFDKWSSVDSLFTTCCEDDHFKISIIKEVNNISQTYNNFLNNLRKDINIYSYYNNGKKLDLKKLNIDLIITFNPYFQKYMNWDDWKDKIDIYLKPYGVYCDKSIDKSDNCSFKKMNIFKQSKYIFCESHYQKECLEEYWCDNKKFIVAGSPNFDYILKDKKDIKENMWKLNKNKNIKRIIWSPHWAVKRQWLQGLKNGEDGDDLKNGFYQTKEGFSQFLQYADLWLKIPKMYKNLYIIMKPHPNLFRDLESQTNGEWNQQKIENWKKEFLNNPNTQIMENGLYDDLFLTSDAIINDSISFRVEYLPTLKPFLLCENLNGPELNEWGEKICDSYYKAHNQEDIINFIENVVFKENDYKYKDREKALKENIFIPKGGSGNFIKNFIKDNILVGKLKKANELKYLKNIFRKKYKLYEE